MTESVIRKRGRPAKSSEVAPEELLRQAFRMFAREGFEAASLRKLAADSGVDYTLFRHHFGSKDLLWRAAVQAEFTPFALELLQILQSAPTEANIVDALRKNITAALLLAAADQDRISVLYRDPGDPERRQWLYDTFIAPYLAHVDSTFRQAQEQQLIRPLPLESLHAMLNGVIRLIVDPGVMAPRMQPILQNPQKLNAYVEGAVTALFDGIRV